MRDDISSTSYQQTKFIRSLNCFLKRTGHIVADYPRTVITVGESNF